MGVDVSDITEEVNLTTCRVDMELIIDEALKYDKIHECNIFIDKSVLKEMLC